jgi:hypothetical protein
MGGSDLSTVIGRATGNAGFDENGKPLYRNKFTESSADKTRKQANRELNEMAERLSVDRSIVVSVFPSSLHFTLFIYFFHFFNTLASRTMHSTFITQFTRTSWSRAEIIKP